MCSVLYLKLHTYIYRLEGLEYEVLQWCICRLEAWFATDTDNISLKNWDQVRSAELSNIHVNTEYALLLSQNLFEDEFLGQTMFPRSTLHHEMNHTISQKHNCMTVLRFANSQEHVLTGGHGLMVNGYDPVIKALARDLDIRLNHRHAEERCDTSIVEWNPR